MEIEWIAVGKKGAALSDISSCVLPELRESNNSRRSVSSSSSIAAVAAEVEVIAVVMIQSKTRWRRTGG